MVEGMQMPHPLYNFGCEQLCHDMILFVAKWYTRLRPAISTALCHWLPSLVLFMSFLLFSFLPQYTRGPFFIRTVRIWNALLDDVGFSVIISLSLLKAHLPFSYYKQSLCKSYDPEDPRSFMSICTSCKKARYLIKEH